MCGIAGIVASQPGLASIENLSKMSAAIAHRGPDGEAFWINPEGTCGLAHRRLAIIDLSDQAKQPMPYQKRFQVLHNGEIYNYLELREDLEKKGYPFHTHSDTEVIAAAYLHYGAACVDHFDGMFAFAIWDTETATLFAARDRFGEKPFYYFLSPEKFCFASEMKALWAGGIPRIVNQRMLFNFLTIGYVENPGKPDETFFEHILQLPPASVLTYSFLEKEAVIERYWDIPIDQPVELIPEKDALEKFSGLLQKSVQLRLRSDVPVGMSLSGGLDSSSIAALASEAGASSFSRQSFSMVFPGYAKDEAAFARTVNEQFNLRGHAIELQGAAAAGLLEKVMYHQEEPISSASCLLQYAVYEAAKKEGTKVLLDGQGADETLAGYHKYYKWYWQELFRKRRLISSGEREAARKLGVTESFGLKNMAAALLPSLASNLLENRYLVVALAQPDLETEFVRLQSREAYYSTPDIFNLRGALYFNTMIHGLAELLRYADRNSMAHGREVRLPFLSHELVEFLFQLPSSFKIKKGRTKWLLRKTMENKLPASITWRTDKTGFEPPQKEWMTQEPVQELIQESRRRLVQEKILKPEILDKKIQPHEAYAAEQNDWRYLTAAYLFR